MIVKRIEPLSLAKLTGVLYAACGLVGGFFLALFSLMGGAASENTGGPVLGALFGVGAVIFLPVLYGGVGFLGSLLMASLYNLLAKRVGGIELQIESTPSVSSGQGV